MHKLATMLVAIGALALVFITLAPEPAEARHGWRRGYWGPGVGVYVGPRYGYGYGYRRPYYRSYYPYAYYPYWRRPYRYRYW